MVKKQKEKGRLSINLVANITAFLVHTGIQFFIVPLLSKKVGVEAYGFISVANEFVQYANLLGILLNGVAGRFIAVEIHKGNIKRANQYFNSVIISDIILSAIFALVGVLFVFRLEYLLVISLELVTDVKILFFITFLNYIITILLAAMTVATFVKNRIDIAAVRNIIGYLVELIVICCLFLFTPNVKVYYLAIGALVSTVYRAIANIRITTILMPEISINFKEFNPCMVVTLLKTGIWVSVSRMSDSLLGGTSLILGNLYLGGEAVGLISLAKTLPNCLNTLFYTIYNVFTPGLVQSHAEGNIEGMVIKGKNGMRIMSFILMPIIAGLLVFSPDFFALWLKGRSCNEIMSISNYARIIFVGMLVQMPVLTLNYFAQATNKLRGQVLFSLVDAILCLLLVLLGLTKTPIGAYSIVLGLCINSIILWTFFIPIHAARLIGKKWYTFYPLYTKCLMCTAGLIIFYFILKANISLNTWVMFISRISLIGGIGYFYGFIVYFSKEEKNEILKKTRRLINKRE